MTDTTKLALTATLMIAAVPGFAQTERTGTSNPDASIVTASPETPAAAPAKPSAAIVSSTEGSREGLEPVPVTSAGITAYATPVLTRRTEPQQPAETSPAIETARRPLTAGAPSDIDAGIVTYVPSRPNEIPEGAILRVRMISSLSTRTTKAGTSFSSEVTEPLLRDGKVIIPVGALVDGQVTTVRGGRRIGGAAQIHLEPRTVTLPDGSHYVLHARVIDTDGYSRTRVDSEGTIVRRDHVKGTMAVFALTTGSAAAAGAVFGGAPGALIGAGVGAGLSAVWWLKQDHQTELNKQTAIVFCLSAPLMTTPLSADAAPSPATGPTGE